MEKGIKFLGNCFSEVRVLIDDQLDIYTKNDTNMILFLTTCLMPIGIILTFTSLNPFSYKPLMLICYLSIGFISLFIAAGYERSKMLFKKAGYGFKFKRYNLRRIKSELLNFSEVDFVNISRLQRGLKVEHKINNKNLVKNSSAASYTFLYSMMHIIVKDGILDLKTNNRRNFFEMLSDSFEMNGEKINKATLESSYSKWNSTMKDTKLEIETYSELARAFKIE